MVGGPLNFLYLNIFSVGLGISVFEGARVLRNGKTLRVSGDCSLCDVLQEVGFVDRVDDVLRVPCLEGRCFLHMRMLRNKMFSIALCIFVSDEGDERWQDSLCVWRL